MGASARTDAGLHSTGLRMIDDHSSELHALILWEFDHQPGESQRGNDNH